MTKGELFALYEHLDDDTEILVSSAYEFDNGGKKMAIADSEEVEFYEDSDGNRPIIVLLFNDEDD